MPAVRSTPEYGFRSAPPIPGLRVGHYPGGIAGLGRSLSPLGPRGRPGVRRPREPPDQYEQDDGEEETAESAPGKFQEEAGVTGV